MRRVGIILSRSRCLMDGIGIGLRGGCGLMGGGGVSLRGLGGGFGCGDGVGEWIVGHGITGVGLLS